MEYEVRFLGPTAVPTGLEEKVRQGVAAQGVGSLMDLHTFTFFDDDGVEWLCYAAEIDLVEVEDLAPNT